MEILYLLIPMSAALVLLILAVFGWAVQRGQFDEIDGEAERILTSESPSLDVDQGAPKPALEQSSH